MGGGDSGPCPKEKVQHCCRRCPTPGLQEAALAWLDSGNRPPWVRVVLAAFLGGPGAWAALPAVVRREASECTSVPLCCLV